MLCLTMTQGAKRLAQLFDRPTQREIADRIGIGYSYLSLLVSGKRIPSMSLAATIEKELGIPVNAWTKKGRR